MVCFVGHVKSEEKYAFPRMHLPVVCIVKCNYIVVEVVVLFFFQHSGVLSSCICSMSHGQFFGEGLLLLMVLLNCACLVHSFSLSLNMC